MCGIFGLVTTKETLLPRDAQTYLLRQLYTFSESRGKESAGLHAYRPESRQAWTLKSAEPATRFIASSAYKSLLAEASSGAPLALLAHSRLVTNGTADDAANNQPVRSGGVTIVHNGIIVNVDALWQQNPDLRRTAEVDTEVAAALLARAYAQGKHPADATAALLDAIKGTLSCAWLHEQSTLLTLATNTGDLFYAVDTKNRFFTFASERYILTQTLDALHKHTPHEAKIVWVNPGSVLCVSLTDLTIQPQKAGYATLSAPCSHQDRTEVKPRTTFIPSGRGDEKLLRYNAANLAKLKRCTRCILPETFPFIAFDAQGVCNYCHNYRPKYKHLQPDAAKRDFIASLQKYRGDGTQPDAIVAFSGGRDSSYGLHLIKKEFGLTPVTFTYDWGMVTDLARRNIARICGELGIQNILVSADIRKKRDNIRKNVSAWLKKPDLGMVPLFMAGDKHFFKVTNQLKAQTGIALDLWCANPLENTDFKTGFCGIPPEFDKKRVDALSVSRRFKMIEHFGKQFLSNPGYLNSSLIDTFGAFLAYYIEPRRDFFFIFDHMVWNEDEVDKVLLDTYDWERSPDSPSTWRIGDGTAPFYNYIYLSARGFSEFDTFRSNQIREGVITRDYALAHVLEENRPRVESLKWYLETIHIDFDTAIRAINKLDTLGLHA